MCKILRTVAKADHEITHELDGGRILDIKEGHGQRGARVKVLLALLTQEIANGDRYITEINIDRARVQALVANRAMVGDVVEFVKMLNRDAATRLLLVEERFDQQ